MGEGLYDMSIFTGAAAPMSTMVDPNLFLTAMPTVAPTAMNFASEFGPQSFPNGAMTDPSVAASMGVKIPGAEGSWTDMFKTAGLKDYAAVAGAGGGLYQSMKAGQMIDEQMRASQESRQLAQSEQERKRKFIETTQNTMSGTSPTAPNSGGTTNSHYYSA